MSKKITTFTALIVFLFISCKNNYIEEQDSTQKIIPVTDIELTTNSGTISIVQGTSYKLNAKIIPENATDKTLKYSSSDESIASVDTDTGLITAKKSGETVKITIKAANNIEKTVNIIVTQKIIPVTDIEFTTPPPQSLVIGDTYSLALKVVPDNATNKKLLFHAENDNVLINENGIISAVKDGNVTITIKTENTPPIEKTLILTVKKKPEIKAEENKIFRPESTAGNVRFPIKTLYGKLPYTPEIKSGGTWLTVTKEETSEEEDSLILTYTENKTIWYRNASIKLKNNKTNTYIKGSDGKDLEIKLIQIRNDNPIATIRWVQGIGEPDASERDRPSELNSFAPHIFYWNETGSTKFFNTRKVSITDPNHIEGHPDSNQCWAKTASNMLHWWYEQNQELINLYQNKKNLTEEEKKQYSHSYIRALPDNEEHKKSYIANIFRTRCANGIQGSYTENGLKWYLFGLDNFTKNGSKSPALFKDIFTQENTPIKIYRSYSKKQFETVIKDALDNGKAIGINVLGNRYAHAITLWGAAFDEEGNIITVYVVDNNFRENRIFPLGIHYKKSIYENHDENYPHLIYYSTNITSHDRHIDAIITLDKGTEAFNKWLSNNP